MEETDLHTAIKRASATDQSRWPSRQRVNRLEPICWPTFQPRFKLQPGATVFTIGSCFARNIERTFFDLGFAIPTFTFVRDNPELVAGTNLSVLNRYTPPSIYQELDWVRTILDRDDSVQMVDIEPFLLDAGRGLVYDMTRIQTYEFGMTPEYALAQRRLLYSLFKYAFDCDVVVITLGLVECWWDRTNKMYVEYNRGLLRNPDRFLFRRLDYPISLDYVQKAIDLLNRDQPIDILLTTSPVPLGCTFSGDDVIVANTYSKSVLRAVAEVAKSTNSRVDYFPSYESVMLSRDTSVWMDDLIHVQPGFVGSIMSRVTEAYVAEKGNAAELVGKMHEVIRLTNHRRWEEALAAWSAINLATTPQLPGEFYVCGAELESRKGNTEAVEALVKRVGPLHCGDLHLRCATALDNVGCIALATDHREKALKGLNGVSFASLLAWFHILKMSSRTSELEWLLVEAERLFKGDSDSLFQLAQVNQIYGNIDRAEKLYREVIQLYPHHEDATLKLAYILFDREQRLEGLVLLENLSSTGSSHLYLHPLATEHLRQGRRAEAKALVDRLIAANPEHTGLMDLARQCA